MNKRNIVTLVILAIVFVIIFLIVFFTNDNKDRYGSEYDKLTLVIDESTFLTVSNYIDKLCLYATNEPDKINLVLKNDVDLNSYKNLSFQADEVYVVSDAYLYKYYVRGNFYTNIMDSISEFVRAGYFVLNYDANNRTFNIEVISKNIYEDANDEEYIFEEIDVNDYNRFEYTSLNAKSRALLYFNDFINKLYFETEKAYDLLSSDTRDENFERIDNLNSFIKKYDNIQLIEYSVNGNEIGIRDNYNNEYIINISSVLKYNVNIVETEE